MATKVGQLTIEMAANVARLQQDMDRAYKSVDGTMKRMRKSAETARRALGALATALGAREITRATSRWLSSADQIAKTASKIGMTTEALQEMRYAAELTGVQQKTLDMAMQRFSRRVGEAANGSGELVKTLEQYNIAVKNSDGSTRSLDAVLGDLANVIQSTESDQEKLRIAFKAFDSEGAALVNTLKNGSDGLDQMREEARKLGFVLDSETAAAAERVNDQFTRTRRTMDGLKNQVMVRLLPDFEKISDLFYEAAANGAELDYVSRVLSTGLKGLITAGIAVKTTFQVMGNVIAMVAASMAFFIEGDMQGAFNALKAGAKDTVDQVIKDWERLEKLWSDSAVTGADDVIKTKVIPTDIVPPGAGDEIDELAATLENLRRSADPAYAALQDIQDVYEELSRILDAGLIDENQFETLAISLTDKLLPAMEEVAEAGERIGGGFDSMAGDAMKAMRVMQRSLDSESKHYKNLELAIQATNVARAVAAVLTQGSGDPYTAFARMAAMAAVVASFGVQLSGSAKVGAGSAAADAQAGQGTGSVLGDMSAKSESIVNATEITAEATSKLVGINQDMLVALRQLQSGITGAAGLIVRGGQPFNTDLSKLYSSRPIQESLAPNYLVDPFTTILTTTILDKFPDLGQLGGALGDFGVFKFVSGLLSGSASVRDQGIEIIGGTIVDIIDDTMVRSFQVVKSKKYALSSSKTRRYYADVSDEVEQQFSLIFESIADSVSAGATAIGMDTADIEQAINSFFVDTIRISLKGLSAEEQSAELEAVFGAMFDNLAGSVVPWLWEFQRVGEGLGETLARVATNVQVTEEAMSRLGFSLDVSEAAAQTAIDRLHDVGASFVMVSQEFAEASTDSTRLTAEAATALVELAGGLESFIDGMSNFIDNFASDEYQFNLLTSDLTRALERVGLSVPETRDGMWELMQTLDAGTESGRAQIAALLSLSDLADKYYDKLEKRADEESRIAEQKAQEMLRLAEEQAREEQRLAEELLAETQRRVDEASDMLRQSFDAEKSRLQSEYDARVEHESDMEALLQRSFAAQKTALTDAYQSTLDVLNSRLQTSRDNISALLSAVDKLTSARRGMEEVNRQSVLSAIMSVRGITAGVRSGDMSGLDNLDRYLSVLTADNSAMYSTAVDYRRDQLRSAAAMADLEAVTGDQLTVEERTLDRIEQQIERAEQQHQRQMQALDDQLNAVLGVDESTVSVSDAIAMYELAKAAVNATQFEAEMSALDAQLNALLGIDQSVQSLSSALAGYTAARAQQEQVRIDTGTAQGSTSRSFVESLYHSMVGRAGDQEGIDWWTADLEAGRLTPSQLVDTFRDAVIDHGEIPRFAGGGEHSGGWRIVGEREPELEYTGPSRIYNGSQAKSLVDTSEMTAAIKSMAAEIRQLKGYIKQTTKNTGETRDRLNRWNQEGIPEERAAV